MELSKQYYNQDNNKFAYPQPQNSQKGTDNDDDKYDDKNNYKDENGEDRLYECQYCEKKFTLRQHLNSHTKRKHSADRPYSCKFCQKKFLTRWELIKHLNSKSKHSKGSQKEIREFVEQLKLENPVTAQRVLAAREQQSVVTTTTTTVPEETFVVKEKKRPPVIVKEKPPQPQPQPEPEYDPIPEEVYYREMPITLEEGIYLEDNDDTLPSNPY